MAKIPEGFATVTPSITVEGAAQAIDLYTKAFGAQEQYRLNCPESGKVMHACLLIGNSKVFVSDMGPQCTASTSSFYLYVDSADTAFNQAKQAGLQELMPVQDMFWGDRTGTVKDRFGNSWTVATHLRDVSPQELEEGRKKFVEQMKAKQAKAA